LGRPYARLANRKEKVVHTEQTVAEMANEVLARHAKARTERTGEPPEVALEAVLSTEDGRRLEGLRDGPHRGDLAAWWQADFPGEDAQERARTRREERGRARREEQDRARRAAWESFIREERRELELRRDGQLAELLGEHLPAGPSSSARRLASEDRRQAREGLVALMSGGKVYYKRLDELCEGDMPARIAANRSRESWLKGRRDGWLARG
jgi:hypothetical protein